MRLRKFASFEWKKFSRSSYFEKGLIVKILLIIGALYFIGLAAFMGVGVLFLLEDAFPEKDPFIVLNNYLIYYVVADMGLRFFLQQLPVMNIKPFMIIPVKRNKVINYLLLKTSLSFFNILPIIFLTPILIVLLFKSYDPLGSVLWFVSFVAISFCVNYSNFLINKNNKAFYSILSVLVVLIGLEYFNIYEVSSLFGKFFYAFYTGKFWVIIPLALVYVLFKANYHFILNHFYIDGAIVEKKESVKQYDLTFLNRFGKLSTFLKNDVRMILRNARPKQVILMSFLFLFYGLIFYTQEIYRDMPAVLAFASMFVTGGFLLSFGQLVPSWDSEYYKLMMSQNISYRKYLESKWLLMVVACVISFILSTPYIYFGWKIYAMIASGALFNIGLNSFITLYGGALNRVPIELNQKAKAFSNTNGFNPTQLLISLPKIFGPMILFYIPYKLVSFNAGLIVLASSGLLGLIFKTQFLNFVESIYQKGKYKTIAAFNEKQ